jgi:hypothetical protein
MPPYHENNLHIVGCTVEADQYTQLKNELNAFKDGRTIL